MVLGDLEAVCLDVLGDGVGTDFLLGLVVRAVVREVFIVLAEELLGAVCITFAIFRRLEVGDDHVAIFVDFQFEDAGVVAAGDELEGVALDVVVLDPVVTIDGGVTVDDIGGDIVDGIGVYPNQDKELAIKDITEQYNEAARFLGNIRSDIKIIIAPGNHDASRVAEPQPAVPEEYAKALYELDNVEFISNPGVVSLDGINVLIYHGRSFDDLVMAIKSFEYERSDEIMIELLQKRHLAPIYGERTPLASELEDYLVIDEIPDVFHTGHIHINSYKKYKGVHLINSGTFQTQTEFQKIYNINPTPAEVPVLHKGKYRHFKFL